jgi:hypothetical protein
VSRTAAVGQSPLRLAGTVLFKGPALGLLVSVLLTASAGATIVPQRGMEGVRIGLRQPQLRAHLGRAAHARRLRDDAGQRYLELRYVHPVRLTVKLYGGAVTEVSTTDPRERTRAGVGVGSTERQVLRKVPHVRCRTEQRRRHCLVGAFKPGHVVTDFSVRGGRVKLVTLGLVLD